MDHKKINELLSAYVDGELDAGTRREVEAHAARCPDCRRELESLNRLEGVMKKMKFKKPPGETWELYWASVYNRLERGVGWILFSLGAIILLFFGGYKMIEGLIEDTTVPLLLKAGILLLLGGVVVLLVSLVREQFFVRRRERYKEIEK